MKRYERQILEQIKPEEVTRFLMDLISCRSDYPPGDTKSAAKLCVEKLREAGIEAQVLVPPPDTPGLRKDGVDCTNMHSVLARLGNKEGPVMVWNAHIDTVTVEDRSAWRHDPFTGIMEEGPDGPVIYGRGAGDDKGSVAAQVMAAVALARSGVRLKGHLIVNPVADEESASCRGTGWLFKNGHLAADWYIVGEQTNCKFAVAERAVLWYEITFKGKGAHAAMPWAGNNAVVKAARFVELIDRELSPRLKQRTHPYLPSPTITVSKFHGGVKDNMLPGVAVVSLDRRAIPGETQESVTAELKELLDRLVAEDPFEYVINCYYDTKYMVNTMPEDPMVQAMQRAYKTVKGEENEIIGYRQGSDGRFFVRTGRPIVIYGPSDPSVGHTANEYVPVSQLIEATKVYALSALQILGCLEEETK